MAQNSVARASARNPHPVRRLRDCRERARALELPGHRPTLSVRLERLRTSHAIAATGRVYAGRLPRGGSVAQARDLRDRQGDRRCEEHFRDGRRLEQRYRPVGDARGVKQSATRLGGPSSKQKQGNSEARPLCLQEGAPASRERDGPALRRARQRARRERRGRLGNRGRELVREGAAPYNRRRGSPRRAGFGAAGVM